jgi:hypothetical protein
MAAPAYLMRHKHIEKLMVFDPAVRTERGVSLIIEADPHALANRAITATGSKLSLCDGAITVTAKKMKR